ncbi:phosphatases II [Sistotremastrum niveocremeum HHB9708]|uniref:protein-tyrosine-phosphatase n=1 Tax=Sistotremastrum niveocremeum HHB9708 TaxID=1314777 RepID=A0A164Q7W5_9AGAM|nr:phosphatases II [Sistotremastrum niveocremeum HHB9708]
MPPPQQQRKRSIPNLKRLDTASLESLPKLQLHPVSDDPSTSKKLSAPPKSLSSRRPNSPSHIHLSASSTAPSPRTPHISDPLSTARIGNLEEAPEQFVVSTILPNFLYLGPELTTKEHVAELESLGVRRILNIAEECHDDQGLKLSTRFDKYHRVPMRDTVEEENVLRGVREVCDLLDDARLHDAPTYVHCKAGKSRSVTVVMGYLIHSHHWTLSQAYAFVLERRKGISPNIGFVSELMNFEELELGGKSIGVSSTSSAVSTISEDHHAIVGGGHPPGHPGNYQHIANGRKAGHIRESLPPAFVSSGSRTESDPLGNALGTKGIHHAHPSEGDSGQEMEVRDSQGRYRHARRAPVDEATLQPMRRVSKAGLESTW